MLRFINAVSIVKFYFYLESALLTKRKLTPLERLNQVESLRSKITAGIINHDDENN
jgi:hypothetical protein